MKLGYLLSMIPIIVAYPAHAAKCRVSGKDVIEHAASLGRNSNATPHDGSTSSCTEKWPAVTVGASNDEDGTCLIDFMQGATIANGWSVGAIAFVGKATFEWISQTSGNSLAFSIRAKASAGESQNISLKYIKLIGPDCSKWAEAIR